ncbi:hypothetical protein ACFLRB_03460 [Acidobacteriota bacterium]
MNERDDFIKKDQILKNLKGFPESFKAELLDKLSDSGFKRGKVSPSDFLEKKMNDPVFADDFMKSIENYAKDEWSQDVSQDNPEYLKELLGVPWVDAEGDTDYKKEMLQKELNLEDGGKEFIGDSEKLAENGRMHIFFFKIADTEQLEDLQAKIGKLEDQIEKIKNLKKLQARIAKLDDQIAEIKKLKDQESRNARSRKLQSMLKQRKDLNSQIKKLKAMQPWIDKLEYLKAQTKTLKKLQANIDKFEYLESEIKKLEELKAKIKNPENQIAKTKRLRALQAKIKKLENEKSKTKDLKYLQANIDNLVIEKSDKFLWWAAKPELMSVTSRNTNGRREVWFKWVQSRLWNEWITDRKVNPTPFFKRRMKRSVSYFIVDLENKIAQLRIQLIRPNALKSLKDEYKQFRTEIDKLLGFLHFSRIPMEAVVKQFLSRDEIRPMTWEIQLPHGAYISAKGEPKLFFTIFSKIPLLKKLGFNVINKTVFFGRKLSCECKLAANDPASPEIRIKIDGEKDVLTVLSEYEQKQLHTIIDNILAVSQNKVIDYTLKKFLKKKKYPNSLSSAERFLFERIVLSFDYHFTRLEDSEIKERHIEDSEWLTKETVRIAVDRLYQEYPDNFIPEGKSSNRGVLIVR